MAGPKPPSREQIDVVVDALRACGAVGADQAVPRRLVLPRCGRLGADPTRDRLLRACVAAAPSYGVPIGSCGEGYYLATTAEDIDVALRELLSRVEELTGRVRALETCRRAMLVERLF